MVFYCYYSGTLCAQMLLDDCVGAIFKSTTPR